MPGVGYGVNRAIVLLSSVISHVDICTIPQLPPGHAHFYMSLYLKTPSTAFISSSRYEYTCCICFYHNWFPLTTSMVYIYDVFLHIIHFEVGHLGFDRFCNTFPGKVLLKFYYSYVEILPQSFSDNFVSLYWLMTRQKPITYCFSIQVIGKGSDYVRQGLHLGTEKRTQKNFFRT